MASYNSTDLFTLRKYSAQTLLRGSDNLLRAYVYANGVLTAPSEGTCTVLDQDGNTVTSVSIYIHDGTGAAYAEIPSTVLPATLAFSQAWRVKWRLLFTLPDHEADEASEPPLDISAGTSHDVWQTFEETCYLVRSQIIPVVSNDDVLNEQIMLADQLPAAQDTWDLQIDAAWKHVYNYLIKQGKFPQLILNSESLRSAHLFKSLAIIFRQLYSTSIGDNNFGALATYYDGLYDEEIRSVVLTYDEDQDGVDNGVSEPVRSVIFLA